MILGCDQQPLTHSGFCVFINIPTDAGLKNVVGMTPIADAPISLACVACETLHFEKTYENESVRLYM